MRSESVVVAATKCNVYVSIHDFKLDISKNCCMAAGKSITKKRGRPSTIGSPNQGTPSMRRMGTPKGRSDCDSLPPPPPRKKLGKHQTRKVVNYVKAVVCIVRL